ncbi:hypothetical protein J416_02174 [Gracilibacillus halophilus YIM-C55.5]|uniref:Enoyl reductase (ER) domain-containing protein n=1 Tax=Gracilibacillus halophilus YIM-C55.5 TaxID=1308866 RepID=N4WPH2_9BACI|nr:acryloyl-CoA reductase [Gracilibacillus halophilus]ENH98012.1 hypothetical protein J416_02174 [Gracilibacillus halophilus YIM-C55.5]
MDQSFSALVVNETEQQFSVDIQTLTLDDLPKGEVLIRVFYSSINYKDSLATTQNGGVVSHYPMVPGIDLAGEVVASTDQRFQKGDQVIATSYEIGVSHFGGFSEYAHIPADWIVPLPHGLSLKESMVIGTAGFTAALSVQQLRESNLTPDVGKVLVTGATGGVGSFAVSILSQLGYHVEASTGKDKETDYLLQLGASSVISREDVDGGKVKPLARQTWAGAVDSVGGDPLAAVLSKIQYGGSVAVSGLTAGTKVPTTVFPFILRGVRLLGIDSVYCPMTVRKDIWHQLATQWKPNRLEDFIDQEITLQQLPDMLPKLLKGDIRGRILVNMK